VTSQMEYPPVAAVQPFCDLARSSGIAVMWQM